MDKQLKWKERIYPLPLWEVKQMNYQSATEIEKRAKESLKENLTIEQKGKLYLDSLRQLKLTDFDAIIFAKKLQTVVFNKDERSSCVKLDLVNEKLDVDKFRTTAVISIGEKLETAKQAKSYYTFNQDGLFQVDLDELNKKFESRQY